MCVCVDEGWRGILSKKLVWSLGTAKAGRSLQTFSSVSLQVCCWSPSNINLETSEKSMFESQEFHSRFLSIEASTGIVCLNVHHLQSVVFY